MPSQKVVSPRATVISHLIKPEDLQHHGTLFAGQMAKWLVEACFVAAARLVEKPEDVVCVQVHGMSFTKPAKNGDIIEIRAKVALAGTTSITVGGDAYLNEESVPSVSGMATFVTVDRQGMPYKHGVALSDEYIAQNRASYDEALRLRRAK